jgi:AraC family transcriptional regulator, regulatory protein of adaptative response / methylated-DNA-[protein]-cysteine methyltransferase
MIDAEIDSAWAWAAFDRRDRTLDGAFVGAVKTTGIYCKPSCPARHPRREDIEFFVDGRVARIATAHASGACPTKWGATARPSPRRCG